MSTIQEIASCEDRVVKIEGAPASGKTEAMARRVASLLEAGVSPDKIMVCVSTGFAAQRFHARLRPMVPTDLANAAAAVRVTTALNACAAALSSPEAEAFNGRHARILNPQEYNAFLEDVKTTGLTRRRIKNLLRFFAFRWGKLDLESDWLLPGEESDFYQYITDLLVSMGAMLPEECPKLCARWLMSDEGECAIHRYEYVFVDDFQNLSYAEQTALCPMAEKQLMIAGNPNAASKIGTMFPSAEGFAKFDKLRHDVRVFRLTTTYANTPAVKMANALTFKDDMDSSFRATEFEGADDEILLIKWNSPNDEINCITRVIRKMLDDDIYLRGNRIGIVVPNKRWARMVQRVLTERHIHSTTMGALAGVYGDPRDVKRCRALTAYLKLSLIAHPEDMVTWRAWCTLGHPLGNSDAWTYLRDWARDTEQPILDCLRKLAEREDQPFPRASALQNAWKSGQKVIEKCASHRGYSLLAAVGGQGLPEFVDLAADMTGEETAEELWQLMYQLTMAPVFITDSGHVHILTHKNLPGLDYDNLFELGCVDGFTPNREAFEIVSTDEDRANWMNEGRHEFYAAACSAKKQLIISMFTRSPLEIAELTKMQVRRIRSEQGERIAQLTPSIFLTEAGAYAPSTIGGDALMAERKLNF